MSDVRVVVCDANRKPLGVTLTDEYGGYVCGAFPPGKYTVVVTGYPPVTTTVRLAAGQPVDHDMELGYPER